MPFSRIRITERLVTVTEDSKYCKARHRYRGSEPKEGSSQLPRIRTAGRFVPDIKDWDHGRGRHRQRQFEPHKGLYTTTEDSIDRKLVTILKDSNHGKGCHKHREFEPQRKTGHKYWGVEPNEGFVANTEDSNHRKALRDIRSELIQNSSPPQYQNFSRRNWSYGLVCSFLPLIFPKEYQICMITSGGSRISPGGRQLPGGGGGANIRFCQFFPKNCMKSKEFGHPGGGHAPLAPPLNLPLITCCRLGVHGWDPAVLIKGLTQNDRLTLWHPPVKIGNNKTCRD